MNKSELITITIERIKDLPTWLPILRKLSENKYITERLYEHLNYENGEILKTNEYCIRIICLSEFIEALMPMLRIQGITDQITFDSDQPEFTNQLNLRVGDSMEPYIVSSSICSTCGGTGKDPKYTHEECISCAGSGQLREYNFLKYLDDIGFANLKPNH